MTAPAWGPGHPAHAAKPVLSTRAIIAIVAGFAAFVLVVAAVVVALFIRSTNTMRLMMPSASMEPTIHAGQTVRATTVSLGDYQPKHGDIVVFTAPRTWIDGAGAELLIKRVIGLPGERVACCDTQGRWMVGGKPLAEPYIRTGGPTSSQPTDITVPDGRLWVMGDNRGASNDSRNIYATSHDISAATIAVASISAVIKP